MRGSTATQRLRQDYLRIIRDPVPYVSAHPLHNNILEWHYVVRGPEGTPYVNGVYHGKLQFPSEFPFKPPAIYMLTPNGRFKCGVRLCLSISDFHPDSWNPAWSEMKEMLRKRQSLEAMNSVSGRVTELGNSLRSGLRANQENGYFGNAMANFVVIVGFGAFMYTVRWVLLSITETSD
ncbi:unnamed protein product [Medioppia subpectinata]|uniref:UBC core domain-containing protein n=1 Tax=Medioppia subpectinata TaxID=1979941 RepID=A0A7R9LNK9_9ACAR|nr:unnamed protein product [Medioppia subpectinata]CAG2120353.1 unnamed protein product [Medioppia subpectinata]